MMKKYVTFALVFLAVPLLTAEARADAIVSPVEIAGYYAVQYLPWILVGAVVGVTAFLLRKFWKKKK